MIISDIQTGMLYREDAARPGVSRSFANPDWRKGDSVPRPRKPETAAIVRDLRDGHAYADVAARHGKPRKAIWNIVAYYGIGQGAEPSEG